jgi:carboxyl-terminal processing protease
MRKPLPLAVGILATILFAGAAGVAIGASSRSGPSLTNLALLNGVIELVQRDYVQPVGPDQLTKDALKGMLSRLDPHSDYMDESEFKESQSDLSGRFGGLGIQISAQDGVPKVISPIDDTPASRAGLAGGDLIVAIDGQSTHGVDLQKIVRILRGNPGTPVKLTISRGAQPPFEVTLTRAIIEVPSIKSQIQAGNIGYVRITEFGSETSRDFRKAIDKLKQDAGGKLRGLVLDLRNDPGGLLNAAVEISGDFLDGGTVVSIRGRQKTEDRTFTAPPKGDRLAGVPVVVLINGASASASEIVAGALQDRHRATILGTPSFGKGSVQSVIPLPGNTAIKLTTARYYTPEGRSIQAKGIVPDIVVEETANGGGASGRVREADLDRHLTNDRDKDAAKEAQKPQAKPAAKSGKDKDKGGKDETEEDPLARLEYGSKSDHQFQQALNLLKGLKIIQNKTL